MKVRITDAPFDPWREIDSYRHSQPGLTGQYGATAIFVGSMRELSQGAHVSVLTLEHYPGMTERELEATCREAAGRWDILDCLAIHRVGKLSPDEPIVLVAVWAAHRAAAFDACRHVVEALKSRVPFWKREQTASGEHWVEPEAP